MDKDKGFLSGVRKRLSGKEKWEPDSDPFDDRELDDDLAVLALDDVRKKPEEPKSRGITLELSGYGKKAEKEEARPEPSPEVPKPSRPAVSPEAARPSRPEITLELPETPEPEAASAGGMVLPVMPEISLELPDYTVPVPDAPGAAAESSDSEEPAAQPEVPDEEPAPESPLSDSLVEDMDRWDMPEERPDPQRWDMPEEDVLSEEDAPASPLERLKSLFAGRKREREEENFSGEESPAEEAPAKSEPKPSFFFGRKKNEEDLPGEPDGDLPEEPSPATEDLPLPEEEELEPDMGEENAGAAIRRSAGKMASGVGRGLLSILLFLWGFISEAFLTFGRTSWEHIRNETKPRNWKHLFSRYLLTLVILYYEIVFKLSTGREPYGFALVYILLFSVCWGLLGYLLTTVMKPKNNRKIRRILIPVLAIPYIVNYFQYQRMGRLYGLNDTVPMTTSTTAMLRLIFSPAGLLHILLFLVPFALYTLLIIHADAARRIKARRRIRTVMTILALWFFTWLLVLVNGNYRWDYGREYTYQAAAADFGLLTALRLDVQNKLGLTRKNNNPPLVMPTEAQSQPAGTEETPAGSGTETALPAETGAAETASAPELEEPQAASR